MNNGSRDLEGVATGAPRLPRRSLLSALSLMLGAAGAALVGVPVVGFILAPVFRKVPEVWRRVGLLENYRVGETVNVTFVDAAALPWDGVSARSAAWLRRETEKDLIAFSVNCTHLGCPVRWEPGANLFMCPCHGGVYYSNGDVAGGPPPRPLFRYQVRVRGEYVEILTAPIPMIRAAEPLQGPRTGIRT